MSYKQKFVLTVLLLCMSLPVFSQGGVFGVPNLMKYDKRRFHFGFLLGYNQFNFRIATQPDLSIYDNDGESLKMVNTQSLSGFSLGIVTNLRLGKYFDLRFIPGISFGSRYVNYSIRYPSGAEIVTPMSLESVYLDLPLLFKYKSSRMLNNIRAYVIAGGQYSFDMISAKKKKSPVNGDVVLKLEPHDIQAQVGVGLDFYCTYFKFTTEVKMSFGFFDMLVHQNDVFSSSVTSLKSNVLQVSFIFE